MYIFTRYLLLVLLLNTHLLSAQRDTLAQRYLHLGIGLSSLSARDLAYSPLIYQGLLPSYAIAYTKECRQKAEYWLANFRTGDLSNSFSATAQVASGSFIHYTFYKPPSQYWQWGWANYNQGQVLTFNAAVNYGRRFYYHTSFGPALRYQRSLRPRWRLLLHAQVQLIGIALQSAPVVNTPLGIEAPEHKLWQGIRLFHPGRTLHTTFWPHLTYQLVGGAQLSLAYQYTYSRLAYVPSITSSNSTYLLSLHTPL